VHEIGYLTDLIGNRAVRRRECLCEIGQTVFLDVHFNAPHWPWEAIDDEAEAERLRNASLRHFDGGSQRTYQRMIERMDMQIGRVLQALDANGLTENTIVIFTSDNGGERFADTWPFTGRKTELLEGGLRIPVLMRWPARLRPGLVTQQVCISMDWLPTLLAAAGGAADPAYPSDGMNLLPVLIPDAAPVPRKLFWRYKANAQRAARDGDWKILKIKDNTFLFNVVDDPMERANLRDRRRDIYDRMILEWNSWDDGMLPEIKESYTEDFDAAQLADHIGTEPVSGRPGFRRQKLAEPQAGCAVTMSDGGKEPAADTQPNPVRLGACPCRRTGSHPRVKPEGTLRRDMRAKSDSAALWFRS